MLNSAAVNDNTEVAIFSRLIRIDKDDLSPEMAEYLLALRFEDDDKARMHELAVKNQTGNIQAHERQQLENFVKVGHLLALLQSKARKSLKNATEAGTVNG